MKSINFMKELIQTGKDLDKEMLDISFYDGFHFGFLIGFFSIICIIIITLVIVSI